MDKNLSLLKTSELHLRTIQYKFVPERAMTILSKSNDNEDNINQISAIVPDGNSAINERMRNS